MVVRGLTVLVLIVTSGNVSAEVVATCGASKGWAYYIQGPLVTESEAGWTADGISKGSFQLIRAGNDFDIVFTDSSGGTVSSKGDGGSVAGHVTQDGDVVVSVAYQTGVFETYVFWLSQKKPEVSFSQAKFATQVRKQSLMVAPCRHGA